MTLVALALVAYLIGSIPFAVHREPRCSALPDPRSYGSGNPGATNVLRTGKQGRRRADARWATRPRAGWPCSSRSAIVPADSAELAVAAAAVAVALGHMYPVFLRFQGGKGVSTALGVLLALDLYVAAGAIATWVIIAFFFRISSLAALVAAVFVPFFSFLLYGMNRLALEPAIALTIVALLLVWRHRTNIRNLLAGTEGRIGQRQDSGTPALRIQDRPDGFSFAPDPSAAGP